MHGLKVIPIFKTTNEIIDILQKDEKAGKPEKAGELEKIIAEKGKPRIISQEILTTPIQIKKYEEMQKERSNFSGKAKILEKTQSEEDIQRKSEEIKDLTINREIDRQIKINQEGENFGGKVEESKEKERNRKINSRKDNRNTKKAKMKRKIDSDRVLKEVQYSGREVEVKETEKSKKKLKFDKENEEWLPNRRDDTRRSGKSKKDEKGAKIKRNGRNKKGGKALNYKYMSEIDSKKIQIKIKKLTEEDIKD